MAKTTISVEPTTRDALMALSKRLGTASIDEALRSLLWEHECAESLAELEEDPEALAADRMKAHTLAEADVAVVDR